MYKQPPTLTCIICKQTFPSTTEYWYGRTDRPNVVRAGRCRKCAREYHRIWKQNDENTFMPNKVYVDPYKYGSKQQRVQTEALLKKLGYKWNAELGFYWKSGYREEDGTWTCILKRKYDLCQQSI